jgi:hypothetical protein
MAFSVSARSWKFVVSACPAGIACVDGAAFAEGFGEGVAESLVVGLQFADALGGDLEATQQGEF